MAALIAATALGIPRSTAAFHLDRLVDARLLTTEYLRLTGRTGPGSGRPAKLYRTSATEISVSVPDRHYDLMGGLLATAIEVSAAQGEPVLDALRFGNPASRNIRTSNVRTIGIRPPR